MHAWNGPSFPLGWMFNTRLCYVSLGPQGAPCRFVHRGAAPDDLLLQWVRYLSISFSSSLLCIAVGLKLHATFSQSEDMYAKQFVRNVPWQGGFWKGILRYKGLTFRMMPTACSQYSTTWKELVADWLVHILLLVHLCCFCWPLTSTPSAVQITPTQKFLGLREKAVVQIIPGAKRKKKQRKEKKNNSREC